MGERGREKTERERADDRLEPLNPAVTETGIPHDFPVTMASTFPLLEPD